MRGMLWPIATVTCGRFASTVSKKSTTAPLGAGSAGHPECAGRARRALRERPQLRPRDLRMRAPAESAVGPGDHVLGADDRREPLDPLRDQVGCSTTSVECVTTPGTRILPAGRRTSRHTDHSCSWRAFAPSIRYACALTPARATARAPPTHSRATSGGRSAPWRRPRRRARSPSPAGRPRSRSGARRSRAAGSADGGARATRECPRTSADPRRRRPSA